MGQDRVLFVRAHLFQFGDCFHAIAEAEATLDPSEKARAERFINHGHRDLYILAHGALRATLAEHFGCHPRALRFDVERHGKPKIAFEGECAIAFNLSHSGPYALVAYGNCASVGADVEIVRAISHTEEFSKTILSADEFERAKDQDGKWLIRVWTLKEAVLKATGEGLSRSMADVRLLHIFPSHPRLLSLGADTDCRDWHLHYAEPLPGVAVALAARANVRPHFELLIRQQHSLCPLRSCTAT